jgi:general secretion pathway protein G
MAAGTTRTRNRAERCAESGYNLIEMMMVMVVLGIIAAIALASIWNALDRAKQRATMADMRTIARAVELYHSDHGFLPSAAGGVVGLKQSLVPYQSSVIPTQDHWSHSYGYAMDPATRNYTLESYGKDGIDGLNISLSTRFQFNADIVVFNGQFVASPE